MLRKILTASRFFSSIESQLNIRKDSYKAIHLTPLVSLDNTLFQKYVGDLLQKNRNSETSSIWVHLTANNLQLINELVNQNGFIFHHSKGTDVVLYKWVKANKKDLVPHYSLHVIGCGGVIIKNDHVLLVREKAGQLKGYYGVPGGRADPNEGIVGCATREVREELGLHSTFKRILWVRELSNYIYGSYDMYFACLMSVEDSELKNLKMCDDEIDLTEWVHLSKLQQFTKSSTVGTQQELSKHLYNLYSSGFKFDGQINYNTYQYVSPIDKRQRQFTQHFLGK